MPRPGQRTCLIKHASKHGFPVSDGGLPTNGYVGVLDVFPCVVDRSLASVHPMNRTVSLLKMR